MRVATAAVLLVLAAGLAGWFVYRPDKTLRVVTGQTAHVVCSETFVSGFDPDEVFAQSIAAYPGIRRIAGHLHVAVNRARRTVRVDWRGFFASRAIYRAGLGCVLDDGSVPVGGGKPPSGGFGVALLPEIAGPAVVAPDDPRLRAALDAMFTESAAAPHRWVKAVVVVHDGQVIAERYAPGVAVDTPLLGYSTSKSMLNALVGILVRAGKLRVDAPAPVSAWQGPDDNRRTITLDNLLRMTSGLAIAQTGSGFDPAARMLFTEPDMAGYAEAQRPAEPPGSAMRYSDASALIVARIVRDATQDAVQDFARRDLFGPLGMHGVVMEEDVAGTPVASTFFLAPARDWARLGLLYLNDGVVGGQRILPEGWVRYAATSTLGTSYGAGFWTNDGRDAGRAGRIREGMPCDTFFASGNLGQRVYIIPSRRLVIVRLAVTQMRPDFDMEGDNRFIRSVLAVVGPGSWPDCRVRD